MQLKIKDIFSTNADLSGIVYNKTDLHVSNIYHKAKILVNEEGTIASAATAAAIIPLMGSSKPHFLAEHPFLFLIRHVETNTILFAGQLVEPELADSPIEEAKPQKQYKPKPIVQSNEGFNFQNTQNNQQNRNNEYDQSYSNRPASPIGDRTFNVKPAAQRPADTSIVFPEPSDETYRNFQQQPVDSQRGHRQQNDNVYVQEQQIWNAQRQRQTDYGQLNNGRVY